MRPSPSTVATASTPKEAWIKTKTQPKLAHPNLAARPKACGAMSKGLVCNEKRRCHQNKTKNKSQRALSVRHKKQIPHVHLSKRHPQFHPTPSYLSIHIATAPLQRIMQVQNTVDHDAMYAPRRCPTEIQVQLRTVPREHLGRLPPAALADTLGGAGCGVLGAGVCGLLAASTHCNMHPCLRTTTPAASRTTFSSSPLPPPPPILHTIR